MFYSKEEEKLLEKIYRHRSESAAVLKSAVSTIKTPFCEHLLDPSYDEKIKNRFLRSLIKDSHEKSFIKYLRLITENDTLETLHEKSIAVENRADSVIKSLGSYGLSKLIQDLLSFMLEHEFGQQEADNLAKLFEARNQLRQKERKFLEDSFKKYLQHQISLFSK